jgi:hypothetical protein
MRLNNPGRIVDIGQNIGNNVRFYPVFGLYYASSCEIPLKIHLWAQGETKFVSF